MSESSRATRLSIIDMELEKMETQMRYQDLKIERAKLAQINGASSEISTQSERAHMLNRETFTDRWVQKGASSTNAAAGDYDLNDQVMVDDCSSTTSELLLHQRNLNAQKGVSFARTETIYNYPRRSSQTPNFMNFRAGLPTAGTADCRFGSVYDNNINAAKSSTRMGATGFETRSNYISQPQHDSGQATSNSAVDALKDAFVSVLKNVTSDRDHEKERMNKFMARQTIGNNLNVFDGNPKDWPTFLSQFKRTTEQCGFTPEENVARLRKCLQGKALDAVRMVISNSANVDAAMDILEMNFGRPEDIIFNLIEESKSIPDVKGWDDFVQFSNGVLNLVATIDNLEESIYLTNPLLLREYVEKLPPYISLKWAEYLMNHNVRNPDLHHFGEWVQEASKTIAHAGLANRERNRTVQSTNTDCRNKQQYDGKSYPKNMQFASKLCRICKKGDHLASVCEAFRKLDVKQRWNEAEKNKLCYNCLGSHSRYECKVTQPCGIGQCAKNHHRLLHKEPIQHQQQTHIHVETPEIPKKAALLRVVPVRLQGPKGEFSTFALLDDASTVTMLDTAVAEKIGADGPDATLCCVWTKGKSQTEKGSKRVSIEIQGASGEKSFVLNNVRTVKNLGLPELSLKVEELDTVYPFVGKNIWNAIHKANPTILIGQDNAGLTVTRQVIQPDPDGVILSKCHLGWAVHGPIMTTSNLPKFEKVHFCCEQAADDLHQEVKDYFRIENFGVALAKEEKERSAEDRKAVQIAEQTLTKTVDRYEIGLPWKDDDVVLPDSRQMAEQRLQCLERKLNRDAELKQKYCDKIDELFEKGYAREVDMEQLEMAKHTWFLPHFAVSNPNKPGKVRVVFDAASKVKGMSLNDFLLAGPDWLVSLFGVLCRFRVHPVAFIADIQEMFNQVQIRDEDTFAQCFLWRNMVMGSQPKVFQMKAMLFGTKSSPFLAQYVKNKNAEAYQHEFPEAAAAIQDNHYVDDYLGGANNVEEAERLIFDVVNVHKKGGFHLTKFASNSKDLMERIPNELKSPDKVTHIDQQERVLGIGWNAESDCFTFWLGFHKVDERIISGDKVPTKRDVLKTAMSLYDPLGFATPITIKSRIFLQQIWRSGIGWDDEISSEMFDQWKTWLNEMKLMEKIEIPRCYSTRLKEATSLQLHTFCDASGDAYSTVVYLRIEFENHVEVAFVASKARVAPLKTLTIPKMELMAAVAGSRLANTIRQQISLNIEREFYWSDSRTVLCWISSEKRLQSFIASRVGEINDLTDTGCWRWVPTKLNVADDATRNKPQPEFDQNCRWLKGPGFLYLNEEQWPVTSIIETASEGFIEEEWVAVVTEQESAFPDVQRFSSWLKLVRTTAWSQRFIRNCRVEPGNRQGGGLTVEEIELAERAWWLKVQDDCFGGERRSSKSGEMFSYRIDRLSPFRDTDGILRIAGRIERAGNVALTTRNPVILDGNHRYVELMIQHHHRKANHQGVETVINQLRERFWILKCRRTVKKQFASCYECKKRKAKPAQPLMGQLPEERFAYHEKPFTNTGVDFFGPFLVSVGRRTEKRYGVLFTCLSVRAIHLEIAHDLSTNSCIMAVRRMVSRRGAVRKMFSDNGTNLRGADRELREAVQQLDNAEFRDGVVTESIEWHFIPPASPHMGGAWERMIGTVKRALLTVMAHQRMNDEILLTVFAEVESIVNNRPLTYVSDDHTDPMSITPNHFLIGSTNLTSSPGVFNTDDDNWRRRWRIAQFLTDQFWKRWLKEYVPTLVNRSKWRKPERNLAVGDLAVIDDPALPRNVWPLGVVQKVLPGTDGVVRTVDVRTARGVLRRPAVKVHPFDRVGEKEPPPGGECSGTSDEEEFYGF
jgi:Pao retrotransposon peptidase/Family of unknown function (DUF5641)/Protein of unknown function (DUF1759)/Integrase zinc binding domain